MRSLTRVAQLLWMKKLSNYVTMWGCCWLLVRMLRFAWVNLFHLIIDVILPLCSIHALTRPPNLDSTHLIQIALLIIKLSTRLRTDHILHLVYNLSKWLTLENRSPLCIRTLGYSPFCPILSERNRVLWVSPLIYRWLGPKRLLKVGRARRRKTSLISTLNAKPDLPTQSQPMPSLDLGNTTRTGSAPSHFLTILMNRHLDKFCIFRARSLANGPAPIWCVALLPSFFSPISDLFSRHRAC